VAIDCDFTHRLATRKGQEINVGYEYRLLLKNEWVKVAVKISSITFAESIVIGIAGTLAESSDISICNNMCEYR